MSDHLPGIPEGPTPARKALVTLLKNADGASDAARKIAHVPAMAEELQRSGAEIVAAGRPPTPDELREAVGAYFERFGITPDILADHASAVDLWVSCLSRIPLAATLVGMAEVGGSILPKPEVVARAASVMASELQVISYRAQVALAKTAEAKPIAKAERMTRDEMIARGFINADGSIPGLRTTGRSGVRDGL